MQQMLYNCQLLNNLISNFDTTNVENLFQMFYNCQSLTSLNMNNFNTENVLNMKEMFKNCIELTTLDLSNFDISKVTNMESMLEGDSNLDYINFKFFEERNDLNINRMFSYIPDDIVYCIIDDENIPFELSQKVCSIRDCQENWLENKMKRRAKGINILKDKCIFKKIKQLSKDFYVSNEIINTSIYTYKLNESENILKYQNSNVTFLDFSSENIDFLMNQFGLDKEKDKIYILIADIPSEDSRSATSDFDFVLILENGTELKLSDIKEDFYVEIAMPIRDVDLANFDYLLYYEKQG
jgi:surface protein